MTPLGLPTHNHESIAGNSSQNYPRLTEIVRTTSSKPTPPASFVHRLISPPNSQLFIDVFHVGVYRVTGDDKLLGALLVAIALGEALQNVLLSRSERTLRFVLEFAHQISSHSRSEWCTSLFQRAKVTQELRTVAALQNISVGPGFESREDVLPILEYGVGHEFSVGQPRFQLRDEFRSTSPR